MTGINRDSSNDCKGIIQSRSELARRSLIADRFTCGQQLFKSSDIAIYQGWDSVTADAVVLKKLLNATCSYRVAQFCQEGMILKRQILPGLLHGEGYFTSNREHWLVMEPAKGELLLDLMASGETNKWSEDFRRRIVSNITSALQCLHSDGWEHGDIKPDNIFVDTVSGETLLIDYSATRRLGESRVDQPYSPDWQHPVISKPAQLVNTEADAYGLALVIWCLWTGVHPFRKNSDSIIFNQRPSHWPLFKKLNKRDLINGNWLRRRLKYSNQLNLTCLNERFGLVDIYTEKNTSTKIQLNRGLVKL